MRSMTGLAVGLCLVVGFCNSAWCEEDAKSGPNLELGTEQAYFYYDEVDTLGLQIMEISGYMPGVWGTITFRDPLYFQLSGRYSWGELEYDGSLSDGTPLTADSEDYIYELRGLIGPALPTEEGEPVVSVYTGLGLRYWNNMLQAPSGYEREIQQLYLPLGIDARGPLGETSRWHGMLELDLLLHGSVESHLSDVDSTYEDASNRQQFGTGVGFRGSIAFEFSLGGNAHFAIGPFFRVWHVEESDPDTVDLGGPVEVGEPTNQTFVGGLQASLVW